MLLVSLGKKGVLAVELNFRKFAKRNLVSANNSDTMQKYQNIVPTLPNSI